MFKDVFKPRRPAQPAGAPPTTPANKPGKPAAPPSMSVIAADAVFEGRLNLRGSLRIEGSFDGDVSTLGEVAVGEEGTLRGTLICGAARVRGVVRGDVTAQRVSVGPHGRILGNLKVEALATEEGAFIQGRILLVDALEPAEELPAAAPAEDEDTLVAVRR